MLISVGLGIICVLLLIFIILQYITITAERDLIKSLQDNNTDLMQTKRKLESRVLSLSVELKKAASKRGQIICVIISFVYSFEKCFCVVQVVFSCPLS